jgi:branched-chain amino acid transport system permease protein
MLYREAGQFKTTYAADQQIFPIRQDRIGVLVLLAVAFGCRCSPANTGSRPS